MKFSAVLLLLVMLAGCATSTPDVATTPKSGDAFDIETTVLAVYNVISGPAGRRDWNRFEALFAPDARMVISSTADGSPKTTVITPKEYVERATPRFNEKGFFERPIATRVLNYGNIAQVWSTYEGREASNQEQPTLRGINSFQLVRIGNEWKVQSIVWEQEDAAHPIPAQYAGAK